MTKSKLILSLTVLCISLAVARSQFINGQEPGQAKKSAFMRLKLEPAKGALEGIALADFEMIAKHAGKIKNLMLDESWMVVQSEDYRRQSNEFRAVVEKLQKAAEDKNVDRATLAYVQMTICCVQCHESLRK